MYVYEHKRMYIYIYTYMLIILDICVHVFVYTAIQIVTYIERGTRVNAVYAVRICLHTRA